MAMSPKDERRKSCLTLLFILFALLVAGGGVAIPLFKPLLGSRGSGIGTTTVPASGGGGIGVTPLRGEPIGISDGSYAFDTDRPDGSLKHQASDKFKSGDIIGAKSLWRQAIAKDTSDAETLIYLENQRVRGSHNPYITLVVGTMLTGSNSNVSTGRDNLQGAYVAQKEYNDGFKLGGGVQILLLVANSGSKADYATRVAQQIVQTAKLDQHIVGVMGWSFSSRALKAVDVLSKAGIPMVSPTASSDKLTGRSPFFFRVAPPNISQATAGAQYAEDQLHVRRVALFFDPNDPYSNSLAEDFKKKFHYQIADNQYTVGKPETLQTLLQAALDANPDLIYFAGYADDMSVLLTDLGTSHPDLKLMGGDALYELGGYPPSARAGFNRLNFTAFAYPDEWGILELGSQEPAFFTTYSQAFDPNHEHLPGSYGNTRANDKVMLSYDATFALLEGCKKALTGGKTSLTPSALQQSLAGIDKSHRIQGVSGQIAFGSDGDPIDKTIVILSVDPQGHIQLLKDRVKECFLKEQCASQ